jgi:hypothetical protein
VPSLPGKATQCLTVTPMEAADTDTFNHLFPDGVPIIEIS